MPSAHAASDLHDAGLRIQYAAFDEDGAVKLSGAEKSVQGNAWQAASAEGWVPPAGLTQDLDGLWKKAEVRHADACSTCHGAPKASAHTANEWAGQLPKRGGRTGHSSAGANELMFKWLQAFAQQPYNHARIRHPMVRKSWLEKGHRAGGEGRESDPFVRVSWEKAAKLVAGELKRVRETYDPGAIWGGSYGWMRTSSVGNARNLLQRVLNLNGGNTTYTGDYSTGCAQVVLPYVIGSNGVYEQVTSWELINEKTELVVLWGADPTITNDIDWCTTIHENAGGLRALKARGVKVVAINPLKPDTAECFGDKAQGIAPRPGTDVAMMLGSTSRACASGSSPK